MYIYILTIPFRILATVLAIIFLPGILLFESTGTYSTPASTIIKDNFENIWK